MMSPTRELIPPPCLEPEEPAIVLKREQAIRQIRLCVWIYFWLLIFEGSLRKWFLPQLSAPLLLIRDPFTLYACWLGLRFGLFRGDRFFPILVLLAWIMAFGSLLASFDPAGTSIPAILFGLRTNFLHLILMLLIPKVFDSRDVKYMGFWFLALSYLMGILMFLQFSAPGGSFINAGAGVGEGGQITGASGRIRPAGTFTFITGPNLYYPCVASFLLLGLMQPSLYPKWALIGSGFSTLAAVIFSGGSRGLILGVFLVFMAFGVSLATDPRRLSKLIGPTLTLLVLTGLAYLVFGTSDAVESGVEVIQRRGFDGIIERVLLDFYPIGQIENSPLVGFGLGSATNAGRTLIPSGGPTVPSEGEWGRIVVESGVVFGLPYILLRLLLTVWLGLLCLKQAKQNNLLPALLYGACSYNLVIGQLGQTTALGFTALVGGLCLAACRVPLRQKRFVSPNTLDHAPPAPQLASSGELTSTSVSDPAPSSLLTRPHEDPSTG